MAEEPIAQEAFERLADAYAARVDTKAHNAFYDRPAVLSLLPPLEGKRVLDAGCGPGVYADWATKSGTPQMVLRSRACRNLSLSVTVKGELIS